MLRRSFLAGIPALALGGCNLGQVSATLNQDLVKARAMAQAMEAAISKGAAAIVAAAPQIAQDCQTAANVCIMVNSLAQSAVSLGQLSASSVAVKDLNAVASSSIVQSAGNGTIPTNPLTVATQILQVVAAVKAANSKVTPTVAVAQAAASSTIGAST